MNYALGFNRAFVKLLTLDKADIDLFLNFTNKSDIKLNVVGQDYKVNINGLKIMDITNNNVMTIEPMATSILQFNIVFSPKKLFSIIKGNLMDILTNQENVKVVIEIKLKVKLGPVTVPIKMNYATNLKELVSSKSSTGTAPTPVKG